MNGQLEPAEFARIAFARDARLVSGALAVLEQALKTDPDASRVLHWFIEKPLKDFSMLTPAEVVSSGKAAALLDYIKVVDVRFTD